MKQLPVFLKLRTAPYKHKIATGHNSIMNLFKRQKRSFNISDPDSEYKVKYLGNVLTAFMRGDGCVDRPVQILWENFIKNENSCLPMQMAVCSSGLKVETKEQGLTEYRFHRMAFCTHLPTHPRLFVWVYRHEGKKLKMELRCHVALLKNEEKAKDVHQQLQKRLHRALQEYTREKTRQENSRLTLEKKKPKKSQALPDINELKVPRSKPVRLALLSQADNYKPPSELSTRAPKLCSITEDQEEEEDICLNPYHDMDPQENITGKDNSSNESGFLDENDNDKS